MKGGKMPLPTALEPTKADCLSSVQELFKVGADINMAHSNQEDMPPHYRLPA